MADILKTIKAAVADAKTEAGERSAVVRVLAAHGYVGLPEIEAARDEDGATMRIYMWRDTPAGDFLLVGGPSIVGEIHKVTADMLSASPAGAYTAAAKLTKAETASIHAGMRRIADRAAPAEPKAPRARRAKPAPEAPTYYDVTPSVPWQSRGAAATRRPVPEGADWSRSADLLDVPASALERPAARGPSRRETAGGEFRSPTPSAAHKAKAKANKLAALAEKLRAMRSA